MARLTEAQRETAAVLFTVIYSRVRHQALQRFPALRDEITSAIGLGVCEGIATFEPGRGLDFERWVEGAALSRIQNDTCRAYTHWKRRITTEATEPWWYQRYAGDDAPDDRFDSLIAPLTHLERQAITAVFRDEHGIADASRAMGVSLKTGHQRQARALKRLRLYLGETPCS